MKATSANFLTVIKGPKQFVIPIYQRTYSWQIAQCNKLFNDILRSEVYEEMAEALTNMIWEVHKEFSAGDELGINFEEKAFYDILKELCIKYDFKYPDEKMIELAKAVKDLVDGQSKFPDWNKRDDIKSALKVGLILLLDEHGYPPVDKDEVYVEIFEQAENFKKNNH